MRVSILAEIGAAPSCSFAVTVCMYAPGSRAARPEEPSRAQVFTSLDEPSEPVDWLRPGVECMNMRSEVQEALGYESIWQSGQAEEEDSVWQS
jgi:hypothetical protein